MMFLSKIQAALSLPNLKKALSTNEAYSILDAGVKGSDTWVSGGCFLLAKVLIKLYPEAKLVVLMGLTKEQESLHLEALPQHALIQMGNQFVDGDGISSEKSLIQRWKKYEGMVGRCWVEPFNSAKHKADYIELAHTEAFKKAEVKLFDYLTPLLRK